MADNDKTDNEKTDNDDTPELAPNMWFTEYDMPYTTEILQNEAAYAREHPEAAGADRHPLAQFVIDQETAVARDFIEGRISEAEFNGFKEVSEARLESMQDGISREIEELSQDGEAWVKDFSTDIKQLADEHGVELKELVATVRERDLEASDISLHLAADVMGTTFEGVDKLYEMLPPHVHDLLDVVETESLGTAHALLDAREDLSSADEHNLERDRDDLNAIQPTVEAEMDEAHELLDEAFERIDVEIEEAKDFADTARVHAELDPDTTVEHMPYKIVDDYDAIDEMEEEVGAQV